MRTVQLIAHTDESTGTLGLIIAGAPRRYELNSATSGLLIAHDLIEHQNGLARLGDIDDELEALGAIWECRGRWGDISRDGSGSMYTPHEQIASDLTRMGVEMLNGAPFFAPAPALGTREHESEADFRSIVRIARREIPQEYRGEMAARERATVNNFLADALRLMRTGARKLRRRFGSPFAANTQLWAIADAVQPFCDGVEYEGQLFRLRYGLGRATCDEIFGVSR